jgi:hypothetical protein
MVAATSFSRAVCHPLLRVVLLLFLSSSSKKNSKFLSYLFMFLFCIVVFGCKFFPLYLPFQHLNVYVASIFQQSNFGWRGH